MGGVVPGCEDWDLWITLAEHGLAGAEFPRGLTRVRPRADRDESRLSGARSARFSCLVRRHEATYRAHIQAVLAAKTTLAADVQERNLELSAHLTGWLIPAMESRSEELAAISARLERVDQEADTDRQRSARENTLEHTIAQLTQDLGQAAHDLDLIKTSTSWRITAPIRHARHLLRWIGGDRR